MKRQRARIFLGTATWLPAALAVWQIAGGCSPKQTGTVKPASIVIDYPLEGSVFPPEFPAPTWQWRDPDGAVDAWEISVSFSDGTAPIRVKSLGEPLRVGKSDPRAVSETNSPPELTEEQAAAHTWTPDDAVWKAIKAHSVKGPATVTVKGYRPGDSKTRASVGRMTMHTSKDEVGAPIFYRDVPLMPSEAEKGVIKPLAPNAVPLIAWRLRNVADKESRVLMEDLHTCANCHSFSSDGKTLGLDMDGPRNDKGLYAIVDVKPEMSIRTEDMIRWTSFRGNLGSKLRVGFMSQVSPNGKVVVTTVYDPGVEQTDEERQKNPIDLLRNYYVANFKDYRFLQVFYPTRGALAWYNREARALETLRGADDPKFVHANATWSPDGTELVFARAAAQDANPEGAPKADFAMDKKELQIKYDLYRIPFNDGKGGAPEPILGASKNGMSNSFPKISPDGKWLVYVQSKNGLLMRPDSQLYIVPSKGGTARRMRCNTSKMNSWHSFSPNGRWLVFSSKSRSPYTQMFLTHIDEDGNDSPAILIENSTAANRAVNIPEFVNIPPSGIMKIDTPAADHAQFVDRSLKRMKEKDYVNAAKDLEAAIRLEPGDFRTHNGLGFALMKLGRVDEAIEQYRRSIELNPTHPEAYNYLGEALTGKGAVLEATLQFEKAAETAPDSAAIHKNLGMLYASLQLPKKAVHHFRKAVEASPGDADARRDLGHALADNGDMSGAKRELVQAVNQSGGKDPLALHLLGRVYGELGDLKAAEQTERLALSAVASQDNPMLVQAIQVHLEELRRALIR